MTAAASRHSDAFEATLARVRSRLQSPLTEIAAAFHLSPFECDVLAMCAAVELDADFSDLCATSNGKPEANFPTFGLALRHFSQSHWSAFADEAPLRRWRLIDVGDAAVLTAAPLRIDERVLHYLLGLSRLDSRLALMLDVLEPVASDNLVPSHAQIARRIVAIWEADGAIPVVQLCGSASDCVPVVCAVAGELGVRAASIASAFVPRSPPELKAFVRLWEREIVLGGFGVLLVDAAAYDAASPDELIASAQSRIRLVDNLSGPVIVRTNEPGRATHRTSVIVDLKHPTPAEQQQAWREALGEFGDRIDTDAIVGQFDMSVPVIEEIAARALLETTEDDDGASAVWTGCRQRLRAGLDDLAQRIDSSVDWDDLVLPERDLETMRAIAGQLRRRLTVYQDWGFAAKTARGLGISALFIGPSGTGKTMAAEVLATALQLDLYRIDLSSVVSKYIGETEKNLRRVFDAAQESGAILLFDEADALFGKRSEVRDSHDRYANIEVGYLLQRMEAYRGLAILTTNVKAAIDPAFMRRLRFVIQFPFPDEAQRAQIWQRTFPSQTPVENLDFEILSRLQIPGGNIRNIAINAAFLAADAGAPVRMHHILAATRTEYAKLERHLSAAESDGWALV